MGFTVFSGYVEKVTSEVQRKLRFVHGIPSSLVQYYSVGTLIHPFSPV